ncbi:hypothetical protein [Gordonia pseudamarae]|jgi:hypothetical protein|uniref:hypothetical protein n=1 Tax=Gordonia pseudamarae TaxID=2831662 RepID=UPI001FEC5EAD|nr:hypothetical protein [Gordonia pseudamarae]
MSTVEIFVDESRRRDYMLCAAVVASGDIAASRKAMRSLKPNNRNRLHMKDETRNRDQLVREFVRLQPIAEAHIFVGSVAGATERKVRTRCLEELAEFAVDAGATRILIESCSQDKQDRAAVTGVLARRGALDRVRADVDRPTAHELLWAADLVAWAYGAGGTYKTLVDHLVTVHNIP